TLVRHPDQHAPTVVRVRELDGLEVRDLCLRRNDSRGTDQTTVGDEGHRVVVGATPQAVRSGGQRTVVLDAQPPGAVNLETVRADADVGTHQFLLLVIMVR